MNGSRHGGGEIQYEQLFTRLDRDAFAPSVVCPESGDLVTRLEEAGVPVRIEPLPLFRRRSLILRRAARRGLREHAWQQRPNLVHCEFERGPYAHDIASELDIPVLLHVRRSFDAAWFRRFELARAHHFIAIGDRFADALRSHGISPDRISIVTDCSDPEYFYPDPDAENVLERDHGRPGSTKIGLVGRFEDVKRQREAVEVLAPLMSRNRDWTFYLIGDQLATNRTYVEQVRAKVPAEISDQVVETGKRQDMPEVLRSLDVLLTLSGGSVMLEALASGLPVVSMSDRNPADLRIVRHQETGLVVPEGDWTALQRAVGQLCDKGALRDELSATGRERACAEFSVGAMVARTQAVYREVLASWQRRRG